VGGGLFALVALAVASASFFYCSNLKATSSGLGYLGSILIVYYGFLSI
jgi:hypothetical protein